MRDYHKFLLVSMVVVALSWIVYTMMFVGWWIPIKIDGPLFLGAASLSGVAIIMVFVVGDDLSWGGSCKEEGLNGRLWNALAFALVPIWGVFGLAHVGGYFGEVWLAITMAVALTAAILQWFFMEKYLRTGATKRLKSGIKIVFVGCLFVYGFYSLYYFDGPYCDSWGFAIAAGITSVFATVCFGWRCIE